ncbi:hypothetical protein L6164_026202 [Bauhinia variegata]|uniref:Uncharacterized protein n=1 Tax=Bauhinia variegata TaxID=167791 RepID=A0ACB9LQX4_BAUVA|nr:hypothetical protein L6164_026202 [Bauhinia variegata]
MSGVKTLFKELDETQKMKVKLGDDKEIQVEGKGTVANFWLYSLCFDSTPANTTPTTSSSSSATTSPSSEARNSSSSSENKSSDETCSFSLVVSDPSTYSEAAKTEAWQNAMKEEILAIQRNKTWELVDLLEGKNKIGLKWIFKTKYNTYGRV